MSIWVLGTTNQIFIKAILKLKQDFQKNKVITGKTPFFVLPILFVLTLVSNFVWKCCLFNPSAFILKKVFVFQKTCFRVATLKTLEFFSDFSIFHLKTC